MTDILRQPWKKMRILHDYFLGLTVLHRVLQGQREVLHGTRGEVCSWAISKGFPRREGTRSAARQHERKMLWTGKPGQLSGGNVEKKSPFFPSLSL